MPSIWTRIKPRTRNNYRAPHDYYTAPLTSNQDCDPGGGPWDPSWAFNAASMWRKQRSKRTRAVRPGAKRTKVHFDNPAPTPRPRARQTSKQLVVHHVDLPTGGTRITLEETLKTSRGLPCSEELSMPASMNLAKTNAFLPPAPTLGPCARQSGSDTNCECRETLSGHLITTQGREAMIWPSAEKLKAN